MKIKLWPAGLLLMILLAACGPVNTPSPTVDAPGTFTAVAGTLMIGMPTSAPATETPVPATPTLATTAVTGFPTVQVVASLVATTPVYISWTPSTCDKSAFVNDVTIPDYSKMYPGTHFTKTWRIKNIGTCSWTKDYRFQYISGNQMGADTVYLTKTVAPGETLDISLEMTAPTTPEDYSNFWRLRNKAGDIFGTTFYVAIEVTKSASTLTPTGSLTSTTGTASATPSLTPVTPVGATNTSTSVPATATSAPPSDTPVPPTEVPPTAVPPTEVPPTVETPTGG